MGKSEKKIRGTIYWLDDNIEQMLYVVQGVFPKLWNLEKDYGVKSKIIILGNGCDANDSNNLYSREDEDKYKQRLWQMFVDKCQDADGAQKGNATFEKNKELIKDPIRFLFKRGSKEEKIYSEIKELWIHADLEEGSEKYNEAKKKTEELLKMIEIDEHSCIAIDLIIFFDDKTRLLMGKRIVSMEMYNYFIVKGHRCFIYSSEADQEEVIRKWKTSYREFYNSKNKITIYRRSEFTEDGKGNIAATIEKEFINKKRNEETKE